DLGEGRVVGRDRTFGGVQLVLHHLIETEVWYKQKLIVRRKEHTVRMWTPLPSRVHARAFVLDQHRRLAQVAVGGNRNGGDAARPIVRHQQRASGLIHNNVTRAAANR